MKKHEAEGSSTPNKGKLDLTGELVQVGTRPWKENCSQFVLGPEHIYADKAYEHVFGGGEYGFVCTVYPDEAGEEISFYVPQPDSDEVVLSADRVELQAGDVVFYLTWYRGISHVAKIGEDGEVISKFYEHEEVWKHKFFSPPIPREGIHGMQFVRAFVFRKKTAQ